MVMSGKLNLLKSGMLIVILFLSCLISYGQSKENSKETASVEEDVDLLISKFPAIVSALSSLKPSAGEKKIVWSRTDLLEPFSVDQLSCNNDQLLINKKNISFLSAEKSNENYQDFDKRNAKNPFAMYKWEIEVEKDGNYLFIYPAEIGSVGFLNAMPIQVISNDTITIVGTGKQWLPLTKGKNILTMGVRANATRQLKILSESDALDIKNEIVKKLNSSNKEDVDWRLSIFMSALKNLNNGSSPFIINELIRINNVRPFNKTDEHAIFLKSLLVKENLDNYKVEKFIYTRFSDVYFYISKKPEANSFILNNNEPRLIFYQQLVYDGQKELAEKYFNKCLDVIGNEKDFANKDKFISALYAQRFISYFRIGRIKDANDIFKITEEKCKPFPIPRYIDGRPDQENVVTLTQSFDETTAFQIKEKIEGYDGSQDQLSSLYKVYTGLNNVLVKSNDGAIGLRYLFISYLNANQKLKKEFEVFCLDKVKSKLEKGLESKNLALLEEVLEQFEAITPLGQTHLTLMEEYYNVGAYLKSLSHAHYIFEKYPELHSKIIAKMAILEELSDLPIEKRKKIPKEFLKNEFKLNGQNLTIEKFLGKDQISKGKKGLGKLLQSISLEPTHLQYWNHPQISQVQPIEPLFTKSNILLNGATYLYNYSIKNNKVTWRYRSESEYKKENEKGPHQKAFYTEHAGNQYFTLTNRNFSGKKTIKCFDLSGNLLWDIADQKNSLIEEPICTPIEAQGKLFGLSYSNRETINTVSLSVYDSNTGNLLNKTPISLIPGSARDDICRGIGLDWNSFTHDKHFTREGSYVYGFSGTGVLFKVDGGSGHILWEKGYQKQSTVSESYYWNVFSGAPSGFIKIYDNVLLCYLPDIQIFSALNKNTGEVLWQSNFFNPRFIHSRNHQESLIFSVASVKNEPILYKVNPENGEVIWQSATNGLVINGEGDVIEDTLYLPSDKSILEYDLKTGRLLKVTPLDISPIKIRCSSDFSVILSSHGAYIFKNDGEWDAKAVKDIPPTLNVGKIFEPDVQPNPLLSFENINLEATLKLPEATYTSPDRWKGTQLAKTSKPFHFLLKCKENLMLFREGYRQKNGQYIPPEIIWFAQYPNYDIFEDTLYVSEVGKITASNIFTREILWEYVYPPTTPAIRRDWNKAPPLIAVTSQYIAYQTENQCIRVLDAKTRATVTEFFMPSMSILRMEGNYIVTSKGIYEVNGYDITQNGKQIWELGFNHYVDLYMEKDTLVFVKCNSGAICFYDLKTGALKVQANGPSPYIMNRWKRDDKIIYAYQNLYDGQTGKPFDKYKAGTAVVGGGYIGFTKKYGQEGFYIDDGKEYGFKTKGNFSDDNYLFTAIRKGNRLAIFSFYFVETFEISNDKLISIDYASITTGRYGSHTDQVNMDLFALDDSLLEIRLDDMYFYSSFDPDLKYEKINSFRVENRKKTPWPHSELYPETEVKIDNWISYYDQKPKQNFTYQAFSDENFAYLKFHLLPKINNDLNNTLYLSADGINGKISVIWDVENWRNAQCSFNIKENLESWKEVDIQGNTNLFLKFKISGAFPDKFKYALPNFNIEFRQKTNNLFDGIYRIGGAYHGVVNQIPWLNYANDEMQSLKDYNLRTATYENNPNFYPQGNDLLIWLKDRRKIKGVESNILQLNNMIVKNAKSYCSVNILSALLLEEIYALKLREPKLDEFSDEFSKKVSEIVVRLNKFALEKEMSKEWADFALSFWTMEVFPFKVSYSEGRHTYSKPFYGTSIKFNGKPILSSNYWYRNNVLADSVNQPFIEWIMPGLIPHFPQNIDLNSFTLESLGTQKAGLGKITFFTPSNTKEICNRKGKSTEAGFKLMAYDTANVQAKEDVYYFQGKKYDCFRPEHKDAIISLSIIVPTIKTPAILKNTGQTAESIMYALENLPSDNNNGATMINNYLSLSGKTEDKELIKIYSKWLTSIKSNSNSTFNALESIWYKNSSRKDIFDFMTSIIKEAKLTTIAARNFFLEYRNFLFKKELRSVIGPTLKPIDPKPEITFNPTGDYKLAESTTKFNDNVESINGGTIYLATKITVDSSEKIFLFAKTINNYPAAYSNSLLSVWVNGKSIIESTAFLNFEDNIFSQKITLEKGDNIILIKVVGIESYGWKYNYQFCIGDVYGAPINGIEMKPVHK